MTAYTSTCYWVIKVQRLSFFYFNRPYTASKYLCGSCLCKQTATSRDHKTMWLKNGYYNTRKKPSKSTLTFSCLFSSWCLCMKYWSLSCCLRSWCFSCRCRSSSSQIAASRAGKQRKVGSESAVQYSRICLL